MCNNGILLVSLVNRGLYSPIITKIRVPDRFTEICTVLRVVNFFGKLIFEGVECMKIKVYLFPYILNSCLCVELVKKIGQRKENII
jgi:hypothetical protein